MKTSITFCVFVFLSVLCKAQSFTDSNLPIVIINTDIDPLTGLPAEIPDDPKILGSMKIIWHPDGSRNYLSDSANAAFLNYNGRLGIEIRGTTSQWLPKKAYSLTTLQNNNTSNNNVSILNMPAENDWVLNSLAYDETLVRDYLTYDLARNTGNYAARGRYCEVVINGDYKGLYIFMEKIKINAERVNIIKMTATDIASPNVTGGFITKCDKTTGGDPIAWSFPTNISTMVDFIHENPKPADIKPEQHNYIFSEFTALETIMENQDASVTNGFPSKIDIPSFTDFMLLGELASNVDVYQYSTFFHKDRNGKLRAGPAWDFNLAYGFDGPGTRSGFDVWQFDNGDNVGAKFWKRLFDNPVFRCYLVKRWNELTQPGMPFDYTVIENEIDSLGMILAEAKVRENARWFTLNDYDTRVMELKTWLQARIAWMNANIGTTAGCSFPVLPPVVISKIHYNPVAAGGFTGNNLEFIEITNNSNLPADLSGYYLRELGITYSFPFTSVIAANSKIYLASNAANFTAFYGLAPFGVFTRNLSNKSQKLSLADPYGNIADYVEYSDSAPWPTAADGTGPYLSLSDLNSDNSLASNWTTSAQPLTGTLPVRLLNFTGRENNGVNELKWQTASEYNNLYFEVQRSSDGRLFQKTGTVTGAGTSNTVRNYSFNDVQPPAGVNYYRLKQVDKDGRYDYSGTISIRNIKNDLLMVYPNPAGRQIFVKGLTANNVPYTIKDLKGQTVMRGVVPDNHIISTDLLRTGVYYITIGEAILKFTKL